MFLKENVGLSWMKNFDETDRRTAEEKTARERLVIEINPANSV